jgi:hypothetical protein
VWNSASHANPTYPISSIIFIFLININEPCFVDPRSAVSHVWNAAAHATDHPQSGTTAVRHAWDNIEHYLHPESGSNY